MRLYDLGNLVKNKYKEYVSVPAIELGRSIASKYPEYREKLTDATERASIEMREAGQRRNAFNQSMSAIPRGAYNEFKVPMHQEITQAHNPDYQSVPEYEPGGLGEKIGKFGAEVATDIVEMKGSGVLDAVDRSLGYVANNPRVGLPIRNLVTNKADDVAEFGLNKMKLFSQRLRPLKITFADVREVTAGRGTPEQLIKYTRLNEIKDATGISAREIIKAGEKETPATKVADFIVDRFIPYMKSNKPGFAKVAGQTDDVLRKEAKKFKSAEEFVESFTSGKGRFKNDNGIEINPRNKTLGEVPIGDISKYQRESAVSAARYRTSVKYADVSSKPVTLRVEKNGDISIADGNHRIAQAIRNGDEKVTAIFEGDIPAKYDSGLTLTDIFNQAKGTTIKADPLIQEAKAMQVYGKSVDDFINSVRSGSATQYGEYFPEARLGSLEGYENITKLGIKPDETVTIYRGIDDLTGKVPVKINDGDFVTTDFDSALSYTGSPDKVASMEVKAKDLFVSEAQDFKEEPFYIGAEYIFTSKSNKNKLPSVKQLTDIFNKAKGTTVNKKPGLNL